MLNKSIFPFFTILIITGFTFTSCKKNNAKLPSEFFKTYGGSSSDYIAGIKPLPDGGFIAVGSTYSNNYIPGTNVDFRNNHGGSDILVIKVDTLGKIVKTALLGGSGGDGAKAIAIANDGTVYVAGSTNSTDGNFADLTHKGGTDIFVIKLNNDLSINKATLLGGSKYDYTNALTVANNGTVYIAGYTSSDDKDFNNLSKGNNSDDAFVIKLNSDLSINKATLLGGSSDDGAKDIAVANDGTVYIAGYTNSNDSNFNNLSKGKEDAFVIKLNGDLSINKATLLGGTNDDVAYTIAVANDGRVYIAGSTTSNDKDFNNLAKGKEDAFVIKLNSDLSINKAVLLGGSSNDGASAIAVDKDGKLIGVGSTGSKDGDIINSFGGGDAFFFKRSL